MQALGGFLTAVLPTDTEVIWGEVNRVPEPKGENFAIMSPTRRSRLATNIDSAADCAFTGSIAGTVLTVTEVRIGVLAESATIFGSGVAANTVLGAQISGSPGGTGTYAVAPSQTLSSRGLSCGQTTVEQATMLTIQIDVHGPLGGDNAQKITTLLEDTWGVEKFAELGGGVTPLNAAQPKQIPFINAEKQYEDRWIVIADLQVNPVAIVPQQYADAVTVDLIEVDTEYPPEGA